MYVSEEISLIALEDWREVEYKHDANTLYVDVMYIAEEFTIVYDAKNYDMEILAPPAITPHIFTLHIAAGSGIEQQTSRRCKRSINIK